ncbi:integrin alpha-IIb [Centroberyx gerrardi]
MAVCRCVYVCVLVCVWSGVYVCLNLLDEASVFSGPTGSLFGFSADFHRINDTAFVLIGAPRANSSQSGVREGGGVFLCPWSPRGGACDIIDFDLKGDEDYSSASLLYQASKSQQWFGASVRSVSNTHILACAPLFHWNVRRQGAESGNTPVGNCLLLDHVTGSTAPFSPCRGSMVEEDYKRMSYRNDQRYCEVGFSSDITKEGRVVLGAPGGFYFQGEWRLLLLQTGLLFSVGRLEEVESHISFNLRIRSKNTVNPNSNEVTVNIQVKAEATLEIRGGSSPPEVLLPLTDWQPAMHPGSLQEVGPLVEHVYELRNLGPSAVNARLTVDFPSTWRHHFLLYLFSNATEESLTCHAPNASQIDPFRLADNSSVAVVPEFSQQEETNTHSQDRETVHVNCSSGEAGCVRIVCDVMALGRGFSAVVRISARLWTHTLTQTPYLNYELVSSASYDVINASSRVQPVLLPSGHTQTQTSVLWPPDGEKEVPIGYVVLSIISGLLLLGLLCCIFWKLGFFKRIRPPSEDDDDEEQLAEESQYAEMAE